MIDLVVCEPEIPGNAGTLLRLVKCMNVSIHLVGPFGFLWSDRRLRRAGMDYLETVQYSILHSHEEYARIHREKRKILLCPREGTRYDQFSFQKEDHLLLGSESKGLDVKWTTMTEHVVHIPVCHRSLNVSISGAIVLCEALRQIDGFPSKGRDSHF